jgi:Inhibitor of Apoptosis domain
MNFESARLASFKPWNKLYKWSPELLALLGFYLRPEDRGTDKVYCYFCDLKFSGQVSVFDLGHYHFWAHWPCAFISGRETDNVPISEERLKEAFDDIRAINRDFDRSLAWKFCKINK